MLCWYFSSSAQHLFHYIATYLISECEGHSVENRFFQFFLTFIICFHHFRLVFMWSMPATAFDRQFFAKCSCKSHLVSFTGDVYFLEIFVYSYSEISSEKKSLQPLTWTCLRRASLFSDWFQCQEQDFVIVHKPIDWEACLSWSGRALLKIKSLTLG